MALFLLIQFLLLHTSYNLNMINKTSFDKYIISIKTIYSSISYHFIIKGDVINGMLDFNP